MHKYKLANLEIRHTKYRYFYHQDEAPSNGMLSNQRNAMWQLYNHISDLRTQHMMSDGFTVTINDL